MATVVATDVATVVATVVVTVTVMGSGFIRGERWGGGSRLDNPTDV